MARVNVGIDPRFLADQHLIAESVEITVITGGLKYRNFEFSAPETRVLSMGKGYINFFKDKLVYLRKRLDAVNAEMTRRGFKAGADFDINEFPEHLRNDWTPTLEDSMTVRRRVYERLLIRVKGQPGEEYYRYGRKLIGLNILNFATNILNLPLYKV